jgi:hypothetical protein
MPILKSQVRPEIIARGCAKCGQPIDDNENCVLTFYRGTFIVLHEECSDFIQRPTQGSRRPVV